MRLAMVDYLSRRDIFSDDAKLAEPLHRKLMLAQPLSRCRLVKAVVVEHAYADSPSEAALVGLRRTSISTRRVGLSASYNRKENDMSIERPTVEQLAEVLDLIHDIAAKAAAEENIPPIVDASLDKIIALSRYKFNVTDEKPKSS